MKWKDVTRGQVAWSLYDWANSAFATSILAFIFSVYFASEVANGDRGVDIFGTTVKGPTLWALTIFISFFIIIMISPALGAMADHIKAKKKFLLFFCYLGATFTCLLFFVAPGMWGLGMVFFIIANIGFIGGNVFYNGLIKDITNDDSIGYISGLGWGFGYMGGFILLVFNLVMVMFAEQLGFSSTVWAVRSCFLTVGIWWGIFAVPLFLYVKEDKRGGCKDKICASMVANSYKEVFLTLKSLPAFPVLLTFIVSFFLFHDAVETTISQSAVFGETVIGMSTSMIIMVGIVIQFVAIFGSFGFLWIEKRVGTKKTLMVALSVWVVALTGALFITEIWQFFILAIVLGLVLGVSQSAARTLFGLFIPKDRSAEFFSFYSISGKVSSLIGPMLVAIVSFFVSFRYIVVPLVILMAIGLFVLTKVDVEKGMEQAKS